MKKRIFWLLLGVVFLWILPIPDYVELNHLRIIDEMKVTCEHHQYTVWLREVIPTKDDNGIRYEYKTYEKTGTDFKKIRKAFQKDVSGTFYYQKIKIVKTNCDSTEDILNAFSIHPKKIQQKKDS